MENLNTGHGPSPRNIRNAKRGGSGQQSNEFQVAFLAQFQNSHHDLHFAADALVKKRPDGAVNKASGQNRVFRRAPFAADKSAAQNLAGGIKTLFIVNNQRKIIGVFILFAHYRGYQNCRVSITADDRGIGLAGETRNLQHQLFSSKFSFKLFSF